MKEILNDFLNKIKYTKNLTFPNLEGLIDGPEDVDSYIENATNNIFESVAKELGWTIEELEKWYCKNWV